MDYIMSLDIEECFSLVDYAYQQADEELLFTRWIPYQGEISFGEFKNKIKEKANSENISDKKEEEIYQEVESIITLFNSGRGEDNRII
jgi:hypothetical protein